MGQKRISTVDLSQEEAVSKQPAKRVKKDVSRAIAHHKGSGRLADMSADLPSDLSAAASAKVEALAKEGEAARQTKAQKQEEAPDAKLPKSPKLPKKERSRRYRFARSLIDRTKSYPLSEAVELLQKISNTKFAGSVEAHLNLTEAGIRAEVTFPHSVGKTTKVAIATDELLKDIESGKTDFDILLATPEMMPKIAKVAKILGPKGLMPNPKTGTITSNPEKKQKELEAGQTLIKAEPKAPLMHLVVGKTSLKEAELAANLTALITAVSPSRILKLTLASSMSPGIRVDLTEFKKN